MVKGMRGAWIEAEQQSLSWGKPQGKSSDKWSSSGNSMSPNVSRGVGLEKGVDWGVSGKKNQMRSRGKGRTFEGG